MRAQSAQWLGGSGACPPRKFLIFRRSEINSDAFWDTFLQQTWSLEVPLVKNQQLPRIR